MKCWKTSRISSIIDPEKYSVGNLQPKSSTVALQSRMRGNVKPNKTAKAQKNLKSEKSNKPTYFRRGSYMAGVRRHPVTSWRDAALHCRACGSQ
jgi:hypothetical protein